MKQASVFLLLLLLGCVSNQTATLSPQNQTKIQLPPAMQDSEISVEEAINNRRSRREYAPEPLSLAQTSQMLWACQGITSQDGKRASPSAGALYPLEIYLIPANVEGINPGIWHYEPHDHAITRISDKKPRDVISSIGAYPAPLVIVITAEFSRTTGKYGPRGERYVWMEAGHAAQNMYLQAETMNLGMVVVGAFRDEQVKKEIGTEYEPLYLIPIGKT